MSLPENGFRAPLPEELAPLFPSYQILSLIATGGMGAVYHAMQTSLEREVAIKILPVEFGNDPGFCEAFAAEAKAMAKLNHPNLIGVYDFGEVEGMLFIVMEYVPGQSLHDACNGSAVEPGEVIRLMTGISLGLAHAHQHGILHRDIKPANILLDSHVQPKIGDFGLARPVDAQVGDGEAIFGTPGYTAPEVLEPPHTMDQRADIFSLGVLLHELLTGMIPGDDPRTPSEISLCDPRFDAVVHKATHPDPQQRYHSASEIADALHKIATTAGPRVLRTTAAAAATSRRRSSPPAHYMPPAEKSGIGKLLVIVLLISAIVALIVYRDKFRPSADPAPAPVAEHEPETVQPEVVAPEPETPASEPETAAISPPPVDPEPETSLPPDPVEPDPVASVPETPDDDPEPVAGPEPKFDVKGFLAHARSVMLKRCEPEIVKRNAALEKNLADFHRDGWELMKVNLDAVYHDAGRRELAAFVEQCEKNGHRLGEEMEKPLKFKQWLVELYVEHQQMEALIDEALKTSLTEHEKTYLHGLNLRVQPLRDEDDPGAADLIQAEIDAVIEDTDYFPRMMLDAVRALHADPASPLDAGP
ncbi:MAG TPA: protein kinase [Luteolibacter sp.]|nr:protein kinase [Luteolibacter sp.]